MQHCNMQCNKGEYCEGRCGELPPNTAPSTLFLPIPLPRPFLPPPAAPLLCRFAIGNGGTANPVRAHHLRRESCLALLRTRTVLSSRRDGIFTSHEFAIPRVHVKAGHWQVDAFIVALSIVPLFFPDENTGIARILRSHTALTTP